MQSYYKPEHKYSLEDLQNMVGPGWSKIIADLIEDLNKLGWDGDVAQVKEKFGGLRFYIGPCSREVLDRITEAENESYKTCEVCGEPGEPRETGWVKTLCDFCLVNRMHECGAAG